MFSQLSQSFVDVTPSPLFLSPEGLDATPNKYFWSKEYLAKSAEAKLTDLWSEIQSDTTQGSFPSTAELAGIFLESMEPSFAAPGDSMPPG